VTTADKALFIADNIRVLANREDAGKCRTDILRLVERIEGIINRPRPKRYAGNCLNLDEDQQLCATPMYAEKHDDTTVECWRCHTTYVIEDHIQAGLDSARGWLYSEREILDIMAQIGRHIPRGTWWSWKQRGVIQNKNEWGAEPRFLLEDVQDAWTERVGRRTA
jgi:hypothetical protein